MPRLPLAPLAVVIVALWAFGPVLDGGFVYDDHHYLAGNPAVTEGTDLWTAPLGEPIQGLWRPLTVLSWRLQWGGPDTGAGAFHLVDLLLHAAVSLAVLGLGRALGLSRVAAGFGALLFAAHPSHAEAVAWVSARSELLAALFVLLAWRAHLAATRAAPWLAALALLAAALAKENALAAPALFVTADLALRRRPLPWRRWLLLAGVVGAVLAMRVALLDEAFPAHGPFRELGFFERVPVALQVFARSLGLLAWPEALRVEYARGELLGPSGGALVAALAFVAVTLLLWRRGRRRSATLLALVPVALFPVLQLVPIGEPFAERFLYLPSVPWCLAAGALLAALARAEQADGRGVGAALVLLLALLAAAIPHSRDAVRPFRNNLALWSHAARLAPQLPLVRYHHGQFLEEAGRFAPGDVDQPGSVDELRASLELDPDHVYAGFAHLILARHALGAVGFDLPDLEVAARHARRAHELSPDLAEPRLVLAEIAVQAPSVVPRAEATAALLPLLQPEGLTPDQAEAAGRLFLQLSAARSEASAEVSTGTSSDDGS